MATDGGEITGTKDKDANIIWLCLDDVQHLETCTQDAEGDGTRSWRTSSGAARGECRNGAEQAKQLLSSRLSG